MNLTIQELTKAIENHDYDIHETYFKEILKIFKDPSTKMIGTLDNVLQVEYFIDSPIMDLNFCHTNNLNGIYSMIIHWILTPILTNNYPKVEVQKIFPSRDRIPRVGIFHVPFLAEPPFKGDQSD